MAHNDAPADDSKRQCVLVPGSRGSGSPLAVGSLLILGYLAAARRTYKSTPSRAICDLRSQAGQDPTYPDPRSVDRGVVLDLSAGDCYSRSFIH